MSESDVSRKQPFDPSQFLTKVGKADYLEVKWRLVWLRDLHPDAMIETELISRTDKEAVFKATVTIPSGGRATGYASETMGDFRDFTEKCETKAIGRALAALGFGTQFSIDHDFDEAGRRVADGPVDLAGTRGARAASLNSQPPPRAANNGPAPIQTQPEQPRPQQPRPTFVSSITPRQGKMIEVLIREHGENPDDFLDRINSLTMTQASDWIKDLQNGVMPWLKIQPPIVPTPPTTPVDSDEALRALLKLGAPRIEQTAHWQHWVSAAGNDVEKWRTLAHQAEHAIALDGEKQGWRFTELMRNAINLEVLDGLQKMAERTNTWSPDLETVLQERVSYFLDQQANAATATT